MFYGYYNNDEITPDEDKQHLLDLCNLCETKNIEVLTTDYCSTESKMLDSYNVNNGHNFISFAADQRNLNNIPDYPSIPYEVNSANITNILLAKNFLYLINSENYSTKNDFVTAVSATNYKVRYWEDGWQDIIFGNDNSYLKKILDAGFDGVYLDIIDGFEYFEDFPESSYNFIVWSVKRFLPLNVTLGKCSKAFKEDY